MKEQNDKASFKTNEQKWPKECIWPKPLNPGEGRLWEPDEADPFSIDEDGQRLIDIIDYMDEQIKAGILDEDYRLIDEENEWEPEKGIDYWDEDCFMIDIWQEDFSNTMNLIKLPMQSLEKDPAFAIGSLIDYRFVNENLLRQAFTRRSFGIEYGTGDSECLEWIGDMALNTTVSKAIIRHFTEASAVEPSKPFESVYDEGELTKLRTHYVCKEHLAARADELGLSQYILYGSSEKEGMSAKEDMMEALIGAVAIDSNWDNDVIERVTDHLINLQLTKPDRYLQQTYYDLLNAWHQKRFGCMPEYETIGSERFNHYDAFQCTLHFMIPENNSGLSTYQRIDRNGADRSQARESAAKAAYHFLISHGLWIRLEDAHLIPSVEDAINQLQELYQKKYIDQIPEYAFEEVNSRWNCQCICAGMCGSGTGTSKTKAKKKAAYMILVELLTSAGICRDEWRQIMYENMIN